MTLLHRPSNLPVQASDQLLDGFVRVNDRSTALQFLHHRYPGSSISLRDLDTTHPTSVFCVAVADPGKGPLPSALEFVLYPTRPTKFDFLSPHQRQDISSTRLLIRDVADDLRRVLLNAGFACHNVAVPGEDPANPDRRVWPLGMLSHELRVCITACKSGTYKLDVDRAVDPRAEGERRFSCRLLELSIGMVHERAPDAIRVIWGYLREEAGSLLATTLFDRISSRDHSGPDQVTSGTSNAGA